AAQKTQLNQQLSGLKADRQTALASWEQTKSQEFRELERAAKKATKQLAGRIRVCVRFGGNNAPLEQHLRKLPGRMTEAITAILSTNDFSLKELADACRDGKE